MSEQLLLQILHEVQSHNERFDRIESDLAGLKTEVVAIKSDMADLKSQVAEIPFIKQAIMDTNATVNRIEEKQEFSNQTLELLSVRSIDQEARIKKLMFPSAAK
ncbi:hypothetical protein [Paenibacillus eucommiae]|uniref:Chromosome segregation ATPase n=1 Tax=Paenibacillus eucommiae TaxID=1355755 RepID=A0ABS4IWU6_9BACL|nr:hypothetical protein [Paenibacillus eucommiae]MBP1991004.1 chromosome segregation ATPase [Paenibacillus eucommiae]